MRVGQCLQGVVGALGIAFHLIGVHAHQRELVALAVHLLKASDGIQHLVVFLLPAIQSHQYGDHVVAVAMRLVESLVCVDGLVEISHAEAHLCQALLIGVVVRREPRGGLQVAKREVDTVLVGEIIGTHVMGHRRAWVYAQARVDEHHRGVGVAFLSLAQGREETLSKEAVLLIGQRVGVDRLLVFASKHRRHRRHMANHCRKGKGEDIQTTFSHHFTPV